MRKSQLQFCASYAGLACTAVGAGLAVAGSWIMVSIAFAASAACWSYASTVADRRRRSLGSSAIRLIREREEDAQREVGRQHPGSIDHHRFRAARAAYGNALADVSRAIDNA